MATLLMIALVVCLAPAAAFASPDAAPTRPDPRWPAAPRLRPQDTRSAALLLQGIEQSATMRAIVDRIEASDVIVYIEMHPAQKRSLAGRLTWLASTPTLRYVRISLNPALTIKMGIATLGHELQHALEVAQEASIVDDKSLGRFYAEHGISMRSHNNGWDTEQARVVGGEVRRELANWRSPLVPQSIHPMDPRAWQIAYTRARGMLPR